MQLFLPSGWSSGASWHLRPSTWLHSVSETFPYSSGYQSLNSVTSPHRENICLSRTHKLGILPPHPPNLISPLIPPISLNDTFIPRIIKLRTPYPTQQQTLWAGLSNYRLNLPLPTTSPSAPPRLSSDHGNLYQHLFPLLLYLPHPANHHGNIICSLYRSQSETFKNRSQILSLPSSKISRSFTSFLG